MKFPGTTRPTDRPPVLNDETPPRFLRRSEVCRRIGLSSSTLHRLRNQGLFPHPYVVSPLQELRYLESDITEWIQDRVSMNQRELATDEESPEKAVSVKSSRQRRLKASNEKCSSKNLDSGENLASAKI